MKVVCIEFKGCCHGESESRSYFSRICGVLPEAEDVDVDLDMKDVKKDTYRAQGAGGQHVTRRRVRLD